MVILTAYREFDYARRALAYGVTEYLLKNQVQEQAVLELLERISGELKKERETENSARQHYYQNMMLNMSQIYSHKGMEKIPCYCILVQQKIPWFLETVMGEGPLEIQLDQDQVAKLLPAGCGLVLNQIIWLDKKTWGVILISEKGRSFSIGDIRQSLQEFAGSLQRYFQENYAMELTILFAEQTVCAADMRKVWSGMLACAEYGIFIRHIQVISYREYNSMYQNTEGDHRHLRTLFLEIDNALQNGDQQKLGQNFVALKKEVFGRKYDIGKFGYVAAHLVELLDYQRIQNGLPSLKEHIGNLRGEFSGQNDAVSIWRCLEQEYIDLLELSAFQVKKEIDKRIHQAMQFIHHHYREKLTVKLVGHQVDLSEMYFNNLFKNEAGMTMGEYLTKYRMEVAKRLFREGQYKVYQVAEMTGYTSPQYFSQIFQKETGYTPREYEKICGKE